jgi:hypothetical protein
MLSTPDWNLIIEHFFEANRRHFIFRRLHKTVAVRAGYPVEKNMRRVKRGEKLAAYF